MDVARQDARYDVTDETIEAAAAVLQALSLPLRLKTVLEVVEDEATLTQISDRLGITYQRLAPHVRHLRVVGALQRRRIQNEVRYRAAPFAAELVNRALSCTAAHAPGARRARPSQ
jgi:DNA-binding transcriptional ArsR family regulator